MRRPGPAKTAQHRRSGEEIRLRTVDDDGAVSVSAVSVVSAVSDVQHPHGRSREAEIHICSVQSRRSTDQ